MTFTIQCHSTAAVGLPAYRGRRGPVRLEIRADSEAEALAVAALTLASLRLRPLCAVEVSAQTEATLPP